jgi:hypothetical protein
LRSNFRRFTSRQNLWFLEHRRLSPVCMGNNEDDSLVYLP